MSFMIATGNNMKIMNTALQDLPAYFVPAIIFLVFTPQRQVDTPMESAGSGFLGIFILVLKKFSSKGRQAAT
jgi:hypothetical protein